MKTTEKMESPEASEKKFLSRKRHEAYAGTSQYQWQWIINQLSNFMPLKLEDLEPERKDCEICFEPLGRSEEPVKLLSCGHVFGHVCLYQWVAQFIPEGKWCNWEPSDAYRPYLSEEAFRINDDYELRECIRRTSIGKISTAFQDGELRPDWRNRLNWSSDSVDDLMPRSCGVPRAAFSEITCPKCRDMFSITTTGLIGVRMEARLHFWDILYEKLGISRSEEEEKCRTDLMRYVQMTRVPTDIETEDVRSYTLQAQVSAVRFALRRGKEDLDPLQTYLREGIFNLGCYGLHEGEYDPTSYEDREIPIWCFQIDRIERGLSPIIAPALDSPSGQESYLYYVALVRNAKRFHRDLKSQVFGPWSRTLFAELGGDRDGRAWRNIPSRMSELTEQ